MHYYTEDFTTYLNPLLSIKYTPGCFADSRTRDLLCGKHTYKKKKKNFLIYKEIKKGAVAKSYITNGLLIYGEIFAYFLIY